MHTLDKYISFVLESIMSDITGFEHWSMGLVIPVVFYFAFLLFKYTALLMPVWLPVNMAARSFRGIFFYKKESDKNKSIGAKAASKIL